MSEQHFVLAYDLGTSGVKAALVTMQGEAIHTATAEYPLYIPNPSWAEQDPELYWKAVCSVTKQVLSEADVAPTAVKGLAFGTQWKAMIPIDKDGNVLRNAVIWLDARAGDQARRLNERFGEGMFNAADYWSKLMWLRENEPEIIEKADMILEVNSFLKWKATGEAAIDLSNCFVRSSDVKFDKLYEDIFAFADIPREKFPRTVASEELVGYVTERAAEEMGLVEGIPVFGGDTDIKAITIGAGCCNVGDVHMYFGSSGWIGFTVPRVGEELYIAPFDEARDVKIFGMQAIGLSLNWVVRRFFGHEWDEMGGKVFDYVNEQIKDIPAGSEGVFATPWFYGDVPPLLSEEVRGTFINLGPQHDRRHMTRAIMEGVCYHLRYGTENICKEKGYPAPTVVNVIGGGSLSDIWMQTLADVLNISVHVPKSTKHAGAVGTAYNALIGLGICGDYNEVSKHLQIERSFEPIPENVAVYEKYFPLYVSIFERLDSLFTAMNGKKEVSE